MTEDELKTGAQNQLAELEGPKAGETYRHYKGGLYVIVCLSIQENTLETLVTYRSNTQKTYWTRTLANFTSSVVIDNGVIPRFAIPRFTHVYNYDSSSAKSS